MISSTGSMTFTVAMVAYLQNIGQSLTVIGAILGSSRIAAAIISLMISGYSDNWAPRTVVMLTEFAAVLVSIAMYYVIPEQNESVLLFGLAYCIRTCIVSAQIGARGKLSKLFAGGTEAGSRKSAALLNIATQGATVFAGLASWIAIESIDIKWVLAFDAISFGICGVLMTTLPVESSQAMTPNIKENYLSGIIYLFKYGKSLVFLDLLLAMVLAGTSTLDARLSGQTPELLAGFLIVYGVAVWISGFLAQNTLVNSSERIIWVFLGCSFLMLTNFPDLGFITLGLAAFKDIFYWLILHNISGKLLHKIPLEYSSSALASRNALMIVTLSIGDYTVGFLANKIPLSLEGAWRACVCLLAFFYTSNLFFKPTKWKKSVSYEKN